MFSSDKSVSRRPLRFDITVSLSGRKYTFLTKENTSSEESFSVKMDTKALKNRVKYLLSLMCDFSSSVAIRFCDQEEMLSTNKTFRSKNYATDVLSFPASRLGVGQECEETLGDILVCLPVCLVPVRKGKKFMDDSLLSELATSELEKMIIHGLVHLKGFDHERSEAAWRVMTTLEKSLQRQLNKEHQSIAWCHIVTGKL